LLCPQNAPAADLLGLFAPPVAGNRRAVAASLLLRFGWMSGFAIGSYLVCERVPWVSDYTLEFSSEYGLLKTVCIRQAVFQGRRDDRMSSADDWMVGVEVEHGAVTGQSRIALRQCLLQSLLIVSEPVIATYHRWSGFSRHALWSMVTSSWGAQFTSIARQLGDAARGITEAQALFCGHPEIARAAPQLYEVRVGDAASTCQRRAACCLFFKSPGRPLCASCPILTESERLERNRHWVGGGQSRLVSA
jgi:hypothetical protein